MLTNVAFSCLVIGYKPAGRTYFYLPCHLLRTHWFPWYYINTLNPLVFLLDCLDCISNRISVNNNRVVAVEPFIFAMICQQIVCISFWMQKRSTFSYIFKTESLSEIKLSIEDWKETDIERILLNLFWCIVLICILQPLIYSIKMGRGYRCSSMKLALEQKTR